MTPLQLLLLRAKRRMMTARGADRLTAPEALRRYLLDDPTLFASALGDDDDDDALGTAPEASTGTGSSDGGSSASESGDDERVSPNFPIKAKAAGASPVNGTVVSMVSQ